ncbi:MAG: sugar phosphate isomerase/epimerase [Phycisphaeraceae bacterium]|nr:sugar phosphate isomerase/epimerase [Phycisphaeraceae bacterium]
MNDKSAATDGREAGIAARPRLRLGMAGDWFVQTPAITSDNLRQVIMDDARIVRAAGFDFIELTIAHAEPALDALGLAFWKEVGQELREMGLEPISVHGPYYPAFDAELTSGIARIVRHARASQALGVRAFVVHTVHHPHIHVTAIAHEALRRDVAVSLALSDALDGGYTCLAMENLPTLSLCYLQTLLGKLDRPNIGMCFDTGHYNVRPEGTLEHALKIFSPRMVHLHLSDNDGLSDQHQPPGKGNFDWGTLLKCLPAALREKHLMLELTTPKPAPGISAAESFARWCEEAYAAASPVLE